MALRLEALYRSGLLRDMAEVERGAAPGALSRVVLARTDIGLGAREAGCATVKSLARPGADLRGRLKGEAQVLAGYCAAVAGDGAAAGLAASLAREEGMAMRRAVDQPFLLRLWADHIDDPLRATLVPVDRQDVRYHFATLPELLAFLESVPQRSPATATDDSSDNQPGPL